LEVSNMRKRKRLLRAAVAAGLLVVAVPSTAYALDDGGRQAGTRTRGELAWGSLSTQEAGCSVDPRDPRLMNPQFQLCPNNHFTAAVPTGQDRAYTQHLVPSGMSTSDQSPAVADRTEIEIGWWMVAVALAAGGAAGLLFGLRRGRLQALS
jgi:hypothetical protein